MRIRCNRCETVLNVPDSAGGQRVRCPKCGGVLMIPSNVGHEPASPQQDPTGAPPAPSRPPEAEPPPLDEWYYAIGDQHVGPFPVTTFKEMLQTGRVKPDDLVWREGLPSWVRACDVPELGVPGQNRDGACPLCGGTKNMGKKARDVYGKWICRKCWASLANRRALAYLLDLGAYRLLCFSGGAAVGATLGAARAVPKDEIEALSWLLSVVLLILFILKDGVRGRSLGKLITGLRVVDSDDNTPVGFGQSFKRNLCLIIPIVPIIVAFQIHGSGYRWGDGWANSRVIIDNAPF